MAAPSPAPKPSDIKPLPSTVRIPEDRGAGGSDTASK
jgi:hypothetical protein